MVSTIYGCTCTCVSALPLTSCGSHAHDSLSILSTTYGSTCLFLSQRSVSWNDSNLHCAKYDAALVNVTDERLLRFIGWWLDDVKLQGFVWVSGDVDSSEDLCSELYADDVARGWRQRLVTCELRNHFICEYGAYQPKPLERFRIGNCSVLARDRVYHRY